jgi:hypothetical protein
VKSRFGKAASEFFTGCVYANDTMKYDPLALPLEFVNFSTAVSYAMVFEMSVSIVYQV